MSDSSSSSSSSSETLSSHNESWDKTYENVCEKISTLKPYDFEPLASSTLSNDNESERKDDNHQKENKNWCLCDHCEIMITGRECWCCQEANEISGMRFSDLIAIPQFSAF